jgi:hypothetical protein
MIVDMSRLRFSYVGCDGLYFEPISLDSSRSGCMCVILLMLLYLCFVGLDLIRPPQELTARRLVAQTVNGEVIVRAPGFYIMSFPLGFVTLWAQLYYERRFCEFGVYSYN